MGDPIRACRTEDRFKRVTPDEVNRKGAGRETGAREQMNFSPKPPLARQPYPAVHLVLNHLLDILPCFTRAFIWSISE